MVKEHVRCRKNGRGERGGGREVVKEGVRGGGRVKGVGARGEEEEEGRGMNKG